MMETLEPRLLLSGLPAFVNTGIGGGGAMFQVTVSPYDQNYVQLACDMSGDYRTLDGGASWELAPFKQIGSSYNVRPAFSLTKTYWADSYQNLFYVSSDKGATWINMSTSASGTIQYIGAISGSPDKVFLGTSTGLWQSLNGGTTWTQVATGSCTGITTVGSNYIYAVLGTTLKQSSDGGATWNTLTVTGAGTHALKRVAAAQSGSNQPYVFVIGDQVGVIRSTDGGATWGTVQGWNNQGEILISPGQTQKVWTCQTKQSYDSVWVSGNGGTSWTSTFNFSTNVTKSWVQPVLHWGYVIDDGGLGVGTDPNTAYIVTQEAVYKTTNGGTSWVQDIDTNVGGSVYKSIGLEVSACYNYQWDPNNHSNQFASFGDFGLIRSSDGGSTWQWSESGNPWPNSTYAVVFDPSVPNKIYAAASSAHQIPTWIDINDVGSLGGGVIVSTNDGANWSKLGTGLPNEACTGLVLDPTSPPSARVLYASMYNSGVWKSSDGGATWVAKPGVGFSDNHHAARLYRDGATGYLYCVVTAFRVNNTFTKGGLFRSTNGGDTWTDLTNRQFAWPTDVAVVDSNTMYLSAATGGGYAQGGAWKTTNGGATWTRVLSESLISTYHAPTFTQSMTVAVYPDNPNIVYCGTDLQGLWVSQDAGMTWAPFTNLQFGSISKIAFDPTDHTQMYLCSGGAGIFHGYYLPALPGDANADGNVNFRDYIVLEGNFGKTGVSFAGGDFNGDNVVNFKDYIILESNFGTTIYSAPSVAPSLAPLSASVSTTVVSASVEQARQFLLPIAGTSSLKFANKLALFHLGRPLDKSL